MATGVPARLRPEEGRKFGLSVGTAFLVLAGLLWWRERVAGAAICAAIGGLLAIAGLLVPAQLGPVYRGWMAFAGLLSRVTTPIFMGVVYFLILTPIGGVMRLFRRNPLKHRLVGGSFWIRRRPATEAGQDSMRHQF
ncbi:MAG TPA: SxtJ family membrane protein [Thermoanaerobaculia bacterium]